jgi:hypothetical protein
LSFKLRTRSKFSLPQECPEDQCNDGTCIYQYQRCDGNVDCRSGEDEHGCRKYQITPLSNQNTFLKLLCHGYYHKEHTLKHLTFFFYLTNISLTNIYSFVKVPENQISSTRAFLIWKPFHQLEFVGHLSATTLAKSLADF